MLPIFSRIYAQVEKMKQPTEMIACVTNDLKTASLLKKSPIQAKNEFFLQELDYEIKFSYDGLEALLFRLVKYADKNSPNGSNFEKDILEIAANEIQGERGPLISPQTLEVFKNLKTFSKNHMPGSQETVFEAGENFAKAYSYFLEDLLAFHKQKEPDLPEKKIRPIIDQLRLSPLIVFNPNSSKNFERE